MQALTIPRPLATRLLFEAQKQPDVEVCGLLAGDHGKPVNIHPISNRSPAPENSFLMDEKEQVEAMRRIREAGQTLLAIYHSHPASPPEPSPRDIEELGYPDALLLIISLNIKGVLEMRGWTLADGETREVPLRVME